MKKKILSTALVIVLICCGITVNAATEVASGTCGADGDNLTWILDSDGVLTISGIGQMKNYSAYGSINGFAPWMFKSKNISSLIVEDGVTSIGRYAFLGLENLKCATISDSVTYVGYYAFAGCAKLEEITLNGVVEIRDFAFQGCRKLKKVRFTDSLKKVGGCAFEGCNFVTYVKLPDDADWENDVSTDVAGSSTNSKQMIYNLNGKSKEVVRANALEHLITDGWYTEPCQELYATNGKSKIFRKSDVDSKLNSGWYTEPVQTLYNVDGESKVFNKTEVATQSKNDWYIYPVQILYAADGRSDIFKKSEVPAQLTVGWYEYPVQTLYTADGRSQVFKKEEVSAQLTVGWYTEPQVIMYALDGRTQLVAVSEIEANEAVGWYYGKPTKLWYFWNNNQTITVGSNRVNEYLNQGWNKEPWVEMYAVTDGFLRYLNVSESDVEAYKKVGWSTAKPEAKYTINENVLKNKALECLKSLLKRPSTLEIYSTTIKDVSGWNDICKEVIYDCSSMNSLGGYSRSSIHIRIYFSQYTNEYTIDSYWDEN